MDRRHVVLWSGVTLIGVDLLFFSGASNFLAAPQSRVLNQVLLLLVAVGLGVAALRGAADLRSPLVMPGLAWVAANALAAVAGARPATSLEALALLLLAAPAYLAVRAVTWSDLLHSRVDRLLIASTLVFTVAYLLQALGQWVTWWSVAGPSVPPLRPGDVGLTVGTVNAVALYLELLGPVAAWLAWMTWHRRALAVALIAIDLLALVVTGSRGAWLGSLTAAGAMLVFLWVDRGRPMPALPAGGRGRLLGAGGALAAAAMAAILGPTLLTRLLSGDAGRIELWNAAWAMFAAHPLTGAGPGSFAHLRPESLISQPNLAVLTTSHNSVLQVLAETGVVGLLAAGWAALVVARLAVRAVRDARNREERMLRAVVVTSLLAMAVHSLVDTQFHLPAVMLMVFILLARLDEPAQPAVDAPGASTLARAGRGTRVRVAVGGLAVLTGAVALVPVDIAMIRAEMGNAALDRGDATAALGDFRAAASMHELAPYLVGEGLADTALGDRKGAALTLARAEAITPLSFITASLASVSSGADRDAALERVEATGAYDATAIVNAALLRFPDDQAQAAADLAAAMAGAPTLVYSNRPPALFDDATWAAARRLAIDAIGASDPVLAAAVASLAGEADLWATYRAAVPGGPEAEALDLLAGAVAGRPDVERARALLRWAPGSQGAQGVLWMMGFRALSQPLIDDVEALSVPAYFAVPMPPVELVTLGRSNADWSVRLPRWPMASDMRHGPKRPYAAGMITIEPVFRPKG